MRNPYNLPHEQQRAERGNRIKTAIVDLLAVIAIVTIGAAIITLTATTP